jgi:hypothetical protein
MKSFSLTVKDSPEIRLYKKYIPEQHFRKKLGAEWGFHQ